ncbi:MAG: HigA family addiction module antidote protein [Acidobacteriia bacterium]|nr:HigA family addiction module antidote protein [Terriglobia bacterium]
METKSAKLPPIFPGETLREDFLEPLGLSANRFAMELHVPVTRINDIAHCRRSISADTALRLARYFGTTPQFRINLQANYDLAQARAVITEVVIMRSCGPFGRTSFDLRANWRA